MPAQTIDVLPRLNIVVPYRDREAHMREFLPHMRAYFARDKQDRNIPYRVTIVEQEKGLPFNRGALKNIGFLLAEADYTCFHDIDYLPLWADYSWTDRPTGIVWFGAETRPVAPGRSPVRVGHDMNIFFGGALLVPNDLFRQVNGYSNDYWGWGYEDMDLMRRFVAAQIPYARRKGTFIALDHDAEGYDLTGALTPGAKSNEALMLAKWTSGAPNAHEGLSSLSYEVLAREELPDPAPERAATYEKVLVRLKPAPGATSS